MDKTLDSPNVNKDIVIIEKIAVFVTCTLLLFLPSHHIVSKISLYYREILIVLIIIDIIILRIIARNKAWLNQNIIIVSGYVIYLLVSGLLSTDSLRDYDLTIKIASQYADPSDISFLILRNGLLYVPIYYVFSMLSMKKEYMGYFNFSCISGIVIGMVSHALTFGSGYMNMIYVFLTGEGSDKINQIPMIVNIIPVLLVTVILCKKVYYRIAGALLSILVFSWIISGSSRQSIFYLVCVAILAGVTLSDKKHIRKMTIAMLAVFVLIIGAYYLYGYINNEHYDRSGQERILLFQYHLSTIQWPMQFIFGDMNAKFIAGGPHNNYLKSLHRFGLAGLILLYLPFATLYIKNICDNIAEGGDNRYMRFMAASLVGFMLVFSIFNYPDESAYLSLYVWYGLGYSVWIDRMVSSQRNLMKTVGDVEK